MGYTPPYLYVRKIGTDTIATGIGITGENLIIRPNQIDTRPSISLIGNDYALIDVGTGKILYFSVQGTARMGTSYDGTDLILEALTADKNLQLKTNGTGLVKFGAYTLGAAVASTGYITILDAAGNPRKLMVQA